MGGGIWEGSYDLFLICSIGRCSKDILSHLFRHSTGVEKGLHLRMDANSSIQFIP
jgi:hypothetical protein